MTNNVDFAEFVWIWNKIQNQTTPKHQLKMARFLTKIYKGDNKKALLMAFRNSGKSTIVGLFCAWLLVENPDLRIMIIAADHSLAKKMVRNVKRIIERHILTKFLLPQKKEQWASDQFTVNRKAELRDPSMLARGLGANITGSRADVIICDDVEVPKTCDSSAKRQELREKLGELDYVLVPDGMTLYVGTPHSFYTIYRHKKSETPDDCDCFLQKFSCLKIPILDKNNQSQWEERFSIERIKAIKRRTGNNKFQSQMMLTPVNITEGRLNADLIDFYEGELSFNFANGENELKINGKKMVSVSCWWDPSFGAKNSDNSVIACVFVDEKGEYWLEDIKYIKVEENQKEKSASFQCGQVIEFVKNNFLPSVRIEKNGIGRFLPELLKQELSKTDISCAVLEEANTKNKELRIIEAFDAVLANKALHANKKICKTPFVGELREWTPNGKCKDDGIDAVAGCLSSQPVRLAKFTKAKSFYNWQSASKSFKANNEFEVF